MKETLSERLARSWVERNALRSDKGSIQVSCWHRRSANGGACAGCYARAHFALVAIAEGADGKTVAAAVLAQQREDYERSGKKSGPGAKAITGSQNRQRVQAEGE